jgi:hypothetical protein
LFFHFLSLLFFLIIDNSIATTSRSANRPTENDIDEERTANGGEEDEDVEGEDEIFDQMDKKAKSYRLKLYKKHKNFKHNHHHRGNYYHHLYNPHHHQWYRQKMLERERERWKKLQEQQIKADYQGQINYYDNSNKFETKDDVRAHMGGYAKEKWPYFDKVVNHLHKEHKDNIPPYIKKYNRRNKQLIDLLEGTIAPLSDYSHKHHERKYHRRKNPNWMEEDLFEQQRPTQNNMGMQRNYIQETIQSSTMHSNALPGEGIHVIYDKKHNDDYAAHSNDNKNSNNNNNYKISSRAGHFVYHVVPQQPTGVGYGRLKRRLPFVAITERRLALPKARRSNNNNNSNNNNLQNHQLMP